jgi:RimJ/RimL family protein N-acetyltransferase
MEITAPPEEITGDLVTLRRYRYPDDLKDVHASIAASLDHLRGWMPWAQLPPTDESVSAFLEPAARDFGGDAPTNYAITLRDTGEYAGGCGLHPRVGAGALEIGYWIDVRHEGRGLISDSARLLTTVALALPGVDRVEIHCDAANARSAAVPARLGYRLESVEADAKTAPKDIGRLMIWVMDRETWTEHRH